MTFSFNENTLTLLLFCPYYCLWTISRKEKRNTDFHAPLSNELAISEHGMHLTVLPSTCALQ